METSVGRYLEGKIGFRDKETFEAYILEESKCDDFYPTLKSTALAYDGNFQMLQAIYGRLDKIEQALLAVAEQSPE